MVALLSGRRHAERQNRTDPMKEPDVENGSRSRGISDCSTLETSTVTGGAEQQEIKDLRPSTTAPGTPVGPPSTAGCVLPAPATPRTTIQLTRLRDVLCESGMRLAIDIGGTLLKAVVVEGEGPQTSEPFLRSLEVDPLAPEIVLADADPSSPPVKLRFGFTRSADVGRIAQVMRHERIERLPVTGGGAYRYENLLSKAVSSQLDKADEMHANMQGLAFLLEKSQEFGSSHILKFDGRTQRREPVTLGHPLYPYMLVMIGSGVSILKATAPGQFQRVSGTCVGGGTALGLAKTLIGVESFDELIELSQKGSNRLDLTVTDLGGGTTVFPPETIACSFGRLELPPSNISKADIAWSIVHMVSYNIGYVAFLLGSIHNVSRIFFAGKFIHNHALTMRSITQGIEFCQEFYPSPPSTTAEPRPSGVPRMEERKKFDLLFLEHDGYLGALGSLLLALERNNENIDNSGRCL